MRARSVAVALALAWISASPAAHDTPLHTAGYAPTRPLRRLHLFRMLGTMLRRLGMRPHRMPRPRSRRGSSLSITAFWFDPCQSHSDLSA